MDSSTDIVVVGGGAGGIGAALATARAGRSVLLLELASALGGTMVRAGVCNWEPGVGGTGIPFDLYRRMKRIPGAVGITRFGRHASRTPPGFRAGSWSSTPTTPSTHTAATAPVAASSRSPTAYRSTACSRAASTIC